MIETQLNIDSDTAEHCFKLKWTLIKNAAETLIQTNLNIAYCFKYNWLKHHWMLI